MQTPSPINSSSLFSSGSNGTSLQTLLPSFKLASIPTPPQPQPSALGLLTSSVTLPPRAKPGRKPDRNPASTAKRNQNRDSARKFRVKAQLKKQAKIDEEKEQYKKSITAVAKKALADHENKTVASSQYIPSTNASSSLAVPLSSDSQSALVPAPGGCGKCVEGGSCPCVDSLIEPDKLSEINNTVPLQQLSVPLPPTHGNGRTVPLRLQSILNPTSPDPGGKSPKLARGCQSEHEIDFTQAFRISLRNDPIMPNTAPKSCGACTPNYKGSCLCRKASQAATMDTDSNTSGSVSSRATSSAPGGPGSCARCQQDPKQRAWCQSVARQASNSPGPRTGAEEPRAKRPRLYDETISCAEAYGVVQRFSRGDTLVEPSPELAEKVLESVRGQPREWSARELDVGFVLSTLKDTLARRSSTD